MGMLRGYTGRKFMVERPTTARTGGARIVKKLPTCASMKATPLCSLCIAASGNMAIWKKPATLKPVILTQLLNWDLFHRREEKQFGLILMKMRINILVGQSGFPTGLA